MNRETGWYAYSSALVLLLLRERAPFRPVAHRVLGQDQPAVLAYRLALVEVLDKVQTTTLRAEVDS